MVMESLGGAKGGAPLRYQGCDRDWNSGEQRQQHLEAYRPDFVRYNVTDGNQAPLSSGVSDVNILDTDNTNDKIKRRATYYKVGSSEKRHDAVLIKGEEKLLVDESVNFSL